MIASLWYYFTDPVLQAPTLGCMLMGLSSALVGVVVVLRKRALLGEALSHAAYPGVVLSIFVLSAFSSSLKEELEFVVILSALASSLFGLWVIEKLERVFKIKSDAALCFVLSLFFGIGALIASRLQLTHTAWYKAVQVFLYGQAATMTDIHVTIYAGLSLCIVAIFVLFYHPIQSVLFDRSYAKGLGLPIKKIERILFFLFALAIVIGIRSVGVVLMAGMLIAPAVAARQFSNRLHWVFIWAGIIGCLSGLFGNVLSVELSLSSARLTLPTGPMILLTAVSICFAALLFAPQRGLIFRGIRLMRFRKKCHEENLLKLLWKKGSVSVAELKRVRKLPPFWLLFKLKNQGWIEKTEEKMFRLTQDGHHRASQIIRLHRLWESYLVYLGQSSDKVHHSAEEMEHILTVELEGQLDSFLNHPKVDPHQQPIPTPKK